MEPFSRRVEIQATLYEDEIRALNDTRLKVSDPYLWQQIQESNAAHPATSIGRKVTLY